MGDEKMNKRGTIVLRNIMFMMILFSGVLALTSIFVISMADEYEVDSISEEYESVGMKGLGDKLLFDLDDDIILMQGEAEKATGFFNSVTGVIGGISTILVTILKMPLIIKETVITLMSSVGVPGAITWVVGNMIMMTMYSIVIFVIASSLLKGGKV